MAVISGDFIEQTSHSALHSGYGGFSCNSAGMEKRDSFNLLNDHLVVVLFGIPDRLVNEELNDILTLFRQFGSCMNSHSAVVSGVVLQLLEDFKAKSE